MTPNRPTRIIQLFAISTFSTLLVACAANTPQPAPVEAPIIADSEPKGPQPQLQMKLASGMYRCELGQKIDVQRDKKNTDQIRLTWKGKRHSLQRHDSTSGLPRYEDAKNELLWIDLPWKSVLMDAKSGHPLANECKAAG